MEVTVTPITNWNHVLNAARFTQGKELIDKEPSIKFKKQMVRAEHSPLRCLMFYFDFYDIPYYVSVHLVRHVHAQPFVSTSRPDIDGKQPPREGQRKSDPVNMRLLLNAQEIINISKVRLCNKAEFETRMAWHKAIIELYRIEPILATACAPNCYYRGICPEINSCGLYQSNGFAESYDKYISNLTVFADDSKTTD